LKLFHNLSRLLLKIKKTKNQLHYSFWPESLHRPKTGLAPGPASTAAVRPSGPAALFSMGPARFIGPAAKWAPRPSYVACKRKWPVACCAPLWPVAQLARSAQPPSSFGAWPSSAHRAPHVPRPQPGPGPVIHSPA
jgi:hypothetical protein